MTHEVILSPSSSSPISTTSSRLANSSPCRPVFHKLDRGDDIVRGVAFDGDLRVDGAHERAVAARAGSFVAAMVDDDHGAIEGVRIASAALT